MQPDGTSEVLWTLTDHLNTVRDLADYDPDTEVTSVVNHIIYDAFGRVTGQTDPTVTTLFGFTARAFDSDTGLQNNLNRWYDAETGTWISIDPSGFSARDTNLYRYVENQSTIIVDPSGLGFLSNYWFYLRHPKRMDRDIQIAQNTALVVAGAAGGTAAGIAAGAAVGAVGIAAGSNATATTVAGGLAGGLVGNKVGGAIGGAAGNETAAKIAGTLGGIGGGIGGSNAAASAMTPSVPAQTAPVKPTPQGARPGSVSGNPANRLIETGKPLKDGSGWARRWIRMTAEDEDVYRTAIQNHYDELLEEGVEQGLQGQGLTDFIFDGMQSFRENLLKNFLANRPY